MGRRGGSWPRCRSNRSVMGLKILSDSYRILIPHCIRIPWFVTNSATSVVETCWKLILEFEI